MNPTKENNTPERPPDATAHLAARELESHGFYLTPFLQPGFDVLDAGCGPATITAGIAQAVFPGRVTALDASSKQLEQARRLTEGREIMNIDFVKGSSLALPFADASFDVVFAHAHLDDLPDPFAAIREFQRVTRPGGFIAVCCADWSACELSPHAKRIDRAIQAYRSLQEGKGACGHASEQLEDWLRSAGFTPLACSEWTEESADPRSFAESIAEPLDRSGQFHHANALRQWATQPGARVRQSWKYATGVRADTHTHIPARWE